MHGSQVEIESTDEYTLFEVYLRPTFEVEQAMLAQGANLEVMSPDWFREEMKGYAEAMVKRYQ